MSLSDDLHGTIPPPIEDGERAVYTGRMIIEFDQDSIERRSMLAKTSLADELPEIDFAAAESIAGLPGWVVVDLATTDIDAIESIAEGLLELPFVQNTTPEIIVPHVELLQSFPNDAEFDNQWGLHNMGQTLGNGSVPLPQPLAGVDINAPQGWTIINSAPSVIVAVMDTGIDYNHVDLAANIWTNSGEIAGNGIDDDTNGYIDDIRGWDFGDDDNDPFDTNAHGTSVAGIIGAVGDNSIGVAGVAWSVQIMPIKIFGDAGGTSNLRIINAIGYAAANGATISNHSWGYSLTALQNAFFPDPMAEQKAQSFVDSICDAMGAANTHLFAVAAGNNPAVNNDTDALNALYPAACPQDNVIVVTGINTNGIRNGSYGPTTVDLAAPGAWIRTTRPGDLYIYFSGTSAAVAFVTGAAALVKEQNPGYSIAEIKAALLNVRPQAALVGDVLSNGALYLSSIPSLPVTLSYFHAERRDAETVFVWQTATEISNAGFNILAETIAGMSQLNGELIPSHAIDSVEPLTYNFSATSDARRFYVQEVALSGAVELSGPYDLNIDYGTFVGESEAEIEEEGEGGTGESAYFIYIPTIQ